MAKILSYLGRYFCIDEPQTTIEVYRGFESTNVSFSDLGDANFEQILKKPEQDIFDEGVWVRCTNGVEIDFYKDGLTLKKSDGSLSRYRKR